MRRALLSVFGVVALSLASPAGALARHHRHHHKAKSKAHHAQVHFEHVGVNGVTSQPRPMGKDEPTTLEPPSPATEGAGKIASFSEGVLTIALNDGSSVSGKVTSSTEIKCEKADTSPASTEGDKESEDDMRTNEGSSSEGDDKDGEEGDDNGTGDDGQVGGAPEPPCDSSALTAGVVVREAELRVTPTGAEFESIVLVR
jgi:hypothetical protein